MKMDIFGKRSLLFAHRWAGVVLSLFVIILSLTGSLLAYGDRAMAVLHPAYAIDPESPRLALDDLVSRVTRERPDLELMQVRIPSDPRTALIGIGMSEADAGRMSIFAIDPANAEVRDTRPIHENMVGLATILHSLWILGSTGQVIVGSFGIGFLGILITGLWTWWPGTARIGRSLRVRTRGRARLILIDIHRSSGAILGLLILFIVVTGIGLAFPAQVQAVVSAATPAGASVQAMSMPEDVHEGHAKTGVPFDIALARARSGKEGQTLVSVTLPGRHMPDFTFTFADRQGVLSSVSISDMTGAPIAPVQAAEPSAGLAVRTLSALHSGRYWQEPGRILFTVLGLLPVFWALSGLAMYLLRRR